jgi:hypothetical protein
MFVKLPRLTTAEIVARYEAGEPMATIALRALVSYPHIRSILKRAGVQLRTHAEARRLGVEQRRARALAKAGRGQGNGACAP